MTTKAGESGQMPAVMPSPPNRTRETSRRIDFARSGPYFAGLLAVTLVAFWPTYLSLPVASSSFYTHLHAVTASAWMVLLIVQPLAVRRKRLGLHRGLGRVSYALATAIVVSIVLLAHNRLRLATPDAYPLQTYILYLQVSLGFLFGLCYALAIATRRRTILHARFMVCTALTLIDPIVIRLMFWADPTPSWNYQWFTYGLTDVLFVALIWIERGTRGGRWIFPAMLAIFVLSQVPALLFLTELPGWQAFAQWFRALPLT